MAQTSPVSFGNPVAAPFQLQAQNLQQQQQLAQAMMQQGMTPIDPMRNTGRLVVPISPLEGLTHMGQALAGAMMNNSVDQKMVNLGQQQWGAMIKAAQPQPIYANNTQAPTPTPAAAPATVPDVNPNGDLANLASDPSIYQNAGASSPAVPMSRGNAGAAVPEPPAVAPDAGQKLASAIMGGMNFAPSAGTDTVTNPVASDGAASPSPQALGAALAGGAPAGQQIIGYRPSLTNPAGLPPEFATYMQMFAPEKYMELQGKMYEPTELMKTMNAAGIDPNSALGRQILQSNITKTNYIAPTNSRPGTFMYFPDGHKEWVPNIPQGGQPVYGPNGEVIGVQAMPGAAGVIGGVKKAEAKASAAYQLKDGFDANGRPITRTVESIAEGNTGAPGAGTPTPGGRFGGYQAPNGGFRPSLTPGEQAASTSMASIGTDRYKAIQASASDSKDRVAMLDNMINLSSQTQFGPGSGKKFAIAGMLNTIGIPVKTNDVENYQEFKKYAINLGAAASKALGGTGTDKQLETMLEGNPNPEMLSKVINNVGTYLKSRELAVQAHANFIDAQTRGGANVTNINQLEAQWRKAYNPQAFQQLTQISMMPQQKASQYVNGLRKSNPRLYQQINNAAQYLQQ